MIYFIIELIVQLWIGCVFMAGAVFIKRAGNRSTGVPGAIYEVACFMLFVIGLIILILVMVEAFNYWGVSP